MNEYLPPLADMAFALEHAGGLSDLAGLAEYAHATPEVVADLLAEAGRYFAERVAPLNRSGDLQGAVRNADGTVTTPDGFVEAYRAFVDAGWATVSFEPGFGGGGFPWLVGIALQEMLAAANLAFSLCPMLTQGSVDLLEAHGSEEQQARFLPKLITGEWTGTMCLTEPQAGSDVGAVHARAVHQPDGTYRITGTKIFITYGEHDLTEQTVHLVLARTPDAAAGTKGISLFLVPKFLMDDDGALGARNDVTCVSIEHKLGIKASPTCVMSFGDADGAVGYLVGDENRGMACMFTMMNQARLSVGLEGLALAERSYQQALAFAAERRQGRAVGAPAGGSSPIIEHPDVRRMLLTMRATCDAMRRLVYLNAASIDRARRLPDAADRERASELVALLTPLTKAWCTDMGVELTSLGVQIHGGVGFCEETGSAQHFRDARIAPIYEGTNGIQAIDLVLRKLPLREGGVIKDHLAAIGVTVDELGAAGPELHPMQAALGAALAATTKATEWLVDHHDRPDDQLAGATPYLRLLATTTAAWLEARTALVASAPLGIGSGIGTGTGDAEFLQAKVASARFFCEQLLPAVVGLVPAITAGAAPLFAIDANALSL